MMYLDVLTLLPSNDHLAHSDRDEWYSGHALKETTTGLHTTTASLVIISLVDQMEINVDTRKSVPCFSSK